MQFHHHALRVGEGVHAADGRGRMGAMEEGAMEDGEMEEGATGEGSEVDAAELSEMREVVGKLRGNDGRFNPREGE